MKCGMLKPDTDRGWARCSSSSFAGDSRVGGRRHGRATLSKTDTEDDHEATEPEVAPHGSVSARAAHPAIEDLQLVPKDHELDFGFQEFVG